MSYTNQTPNYGLPQWLAADKPKFLTDINDAFSTIDTQLKNANDTANTAADNATSALSIAGQAATTAEGAATVAGQAAALAQSVNELVGTLNAKMGTTSIATIGDGTVTGAIDELNTNKSGKILIDTQEFTVSLNNEYYVTQSITTAQISGYTCIGVVGYALSKLTYIPYAIRATSIGVRRGDTTPVTDTVDVTLYLMYVAD